MNCASWSALKICLLGACLLVATAGCSGSATGSSSGSAAQPTVGTGGGVANSPRPAAPSSSPGAAASAPSPAVASGASVRLTDQNEFQPPTLSVPRGTTVTWTNTGRTVHTVTDDPSKAINKADSVLPSGAQPFDSGLINAGDTFTHTFDTPGEYVYYCTPHETLGMVAHITVT